MNDSRHVKAAVAFCCFVLHVLFGEVYGRKQRECAQIRTGGFDCAKKHKGHSLAPPVVRQSSKGARPGAGFTSLIYGQALRRYGLNDEGGEGVAPGYGGQVRWSGGIGNK